jgi:site-specific DNA-methyltransferase (adenine-specific)
MNTDINENPKSCQTSVMVSADLINKIHNENCLETMAKMPDNFIDLTVTSPPYDGLRTYNGYSFDFESVAKELYRVTKEGGVVVWVVGDATVKGSESLTSFKQAIYFKDIGFSVETMIYEKAQSCFGSNTYYLQAFEYMFVLTKGTKPKAINHLRDRRNERSGVESMGKGGLNKNGTKTDRHKKEMLEYGKRKNIWKYGVGGGKTGHPAVFPEQLANDHIISWSNENDIVYDCFSGSGTTAKMSIINSRRWIASEMSAEYCDIIKERIKVDKGLFENVS